MYNKSQTIFKPAYFIETYTNTTMLFVPKLILGYENFKREKVTL